MAITISGTDGIVGAGFTVDNSGVSVTAGVGTFSSIGAGASVPAAGLTGALPTISAANCTNIPAANITGTLPAIDGSALTGTGDVSVSRTTEAGALSGATNYDFTLPSNCFRVDFVGHNVSTSGSGTPAFRVGTSGGIISSGSAYSYTEASSGSSSEGVNRSEDQIRPLNFNVNGASDTTDFHFSFTSSTASTMWTFFGRGMRRTSANVLQCQGVLNLSGNALTTIRFFPYGTGFDSGRFSWTAYSTV